MNWWKMELKMSKLSEFLILALYWNWKLLNLGNIFKTCKFQRMCFTWGSWKFLRFLSFWFSPLYWNQKLGKLRNIFNTCTFQRMYFLHFWVFGVGPYTGIENSKIFSRHVNFKERVLLGEVWNFQGFQGYNFCPYTEIKNWKNSEIFPGHVNFKEFVLFKEFGIFQDFWVFDFSPFNKIKNSANQANFYWLVIVIVSMEKVGNWRGFPALDFWPEFDLKTPEYEILL